MRPEEGDKEGHPQDAYGRGWGTWGLALLAFWLPALGPLIQPGQMTCSHDGGLYLLRVFQLDVLVRQGIVWPRWAPGMVLGYGYPLFNFYPSLSFYPATILHSLGLGLLQSFNLSLALSMLASGLAMYLWARQVLGGYGGFAAAVAYMLAPYQLYDVYWRGNLTESLTLPLLPLALWAALRIAQQRRWRYVSAGALVYAAVLLMHAPAALMLTLALACYGVMLVWSAPDRRASACRLAGMVILGLGAAAFFLLPAYLEQDQVQLWRAITPAGQNFRYHFLELQELFSPGQASDPLLVNPSPPRSLGQVTVLLAAAGLLATWLGRARVDDALKRHAVWAGVALAGVVVMMSAVSEPLWARAPLLPYIQFPWRFLGVGSMLAGWLAGVGPAVLEQYSRQATGWPKQFGGLAAAGVCAVALSLGALPWAYPRMCSTSSNPDQAFYVAFEQATGLVGTTSSGEYLPVAVRELPTSSPMAEAWQAGQPASRWDAPGARLLQAHDDGLSADLVMESDAPIQVLYRAFYFPGWQAYVDGQPVPVAAVPPSGLMGIDVPAGRHGLSIRFESTPLRTAGGLVSLAFVIIIVAIGCLDLRSAYSPHLPSTPYPIPTTHHPTPSAWLLLAALGLVLLAFKLGLVDHYDTPWRWRRLQGDQFKGATYPGGAAVAGRARLVGYDAQPDPAPAGELVYVDLYWTLDKPLDLRAAVRLLDEDGLEWSYKDEVDTALIGRYSSPPPSREWPMGAYADERRAIRILPGTPPGDYVLVAVPFDPDTLQPLPVSAGQAAPGDYPGVVLGRLPVARPAQPPETSALDLAVYTNIALGDDLTLVGYSQDRAEAAPGETVLLTLGWQARRRPQANYALRLELAAPDGRAVTQVELAPGGDAHPTSGWAPGEVVRSQVLVHIPGRAGSGRHTWRITLLDGSGAPAGQAQVGSLDIAAPPRVWSAPAVSRRVGARLGDWAMLVGFDAPASAAAGQSLSVTLVWQALGETDKDYKTFVHLLDAGGQVMAQSDAVPAAWTRPTSGWQAGEFVTDVHTLELKPGLPPGEYRLAAGMYDGQGRRLSVDAGGDAVELGRVQVSAR